MRRSTVIAALMGLALGLVAAATTAAIDQTVEIRNTSSVAWQFTPQDVQVGAGDSVTWVDLSQPGSEPHTVTPDTPGDFTGSAILRPGDTHIVRFERAGTFAYHCDIHPSMFGRVIVAAAAPSPSPTPSSSPAPTQPTTTSPTTAPTSTATPAPTPTASPVASAPTPSAPTTPSPAATSAATPGATTTPDPTVPPAPDRGVLPLAAILLAATLALLLGRRAYRRGR